MIPAMAILEKGGNAFDAVAATGLSLHILEPGQNGPRQRHAAHPLLRQRDAAKVTCARATVPCQD